MGFVSELLLVGLAVLSSSTGQGSGVALSGPGVVAGDVGRAATAGALQALQSAALETSRAGTVSVTADAQPGAPMEPAHVTWQTRLGKRITLPSGCDGLPAHYDVLVHFHGVPTVIEPAFFGSGMNAVLVLVNLGEMSGPYERSFAGKGALQQTLDAVDQMVDERCGTDHQPNRVGLSAWSAGYGAVLRILERDGNTGVDSVLLSDGLHVGYERDGSRRPSALALRPFVELAREAAAGRKLFALTHSSVKTDRYASTTETAAALVEAVGAPLVPSSADGPEPGMRETQRARSGGFQVTGFAGGQPSDHCDQLRAMGQTLFPIIAQRWSQGR